MAFSSLDAHGGQRRQRCRWPEKEHPQVTEQDAAAALQHALAAQHQAEPATNSQHHAEVLEEDSMYWICPRHEPTLSHMGSLGCVFQRVLGLKEVCSSLC